ncbi:CRISPR-associated helicase Cas3' [Candidatus Woesearchaeota archaeon]|nr:CRISPR-associated helicase Cas3' [Candidatus Woesearchaeota archaeon]
MSYSKIYAKYPSPLSPKEKKVLLGTHLIETYERANELVQLFRLPKYKSFLGLETQIYKFAQIGALLHDIGKADTYFQKQLKSGEKKKVSHALLSLTVIDNIINASKDEDKLLKNIMMLAVASHHSPLKKSLFDRSDPQSTFDIGLCGVLEEIQLFQKNFDIEIPENILELVNKKPNTTYLAKRIYNRIKWDIVDVPCEELRAIYVFISGVIIYSDYLSSSRENIQKLETNPEDIILKHKGYSLRDYQEKIFKFKGNGFLQLPTGFGKTESAILWLKENSNFKNFYVLPTTASINGIYDRLKKVFKEEEIGFYHSYFEVFSDENEFSKKTLLKSFFPALNVTTFDQIILSLMNYKKYGLKEVVFSNSSVIIDEVHATDERNLGLLKFAVDYLSKKYGSRFLIMSATFPDYLRKLFQENGFVEVLKTKYVNSIYSHIQRVKIEYKDSDIFDYESLIDELRKKYKKGEKILIVLNTVERAQKLFQVLIKFPKKLLLHSRFILNDRCDREKELKELKDKKGPFIFVSTQIVEISLDIDFDVLYTDCAHFDSLVQRFGRVNRKISYNGPNNISVGKPALVKVFRYEEKYPYNPEFVSLTSELLQTRKITNENDLLKVNNVYYDIIKDKLVNKIEENTKTIRQIWQKNSFIYAIDLKEEELRNMVRTRDGLMSVSMFPAKFRTEVAKLEEEFKEKKISYRQYVREKTGYLTKVPIYWKNGIDGNFINKKYDNKLGLTEEEEIDNGLNQ